LKGQAFLVRFTIVVRILEIKMEKEIPPAIKNTEAL